MNISTIEIQLTLAERISMRTIARKPLNSKMELGIFAVGTSHIW